MLPQRIGSMITIPSHDRDGKRYLDWDGFTLIGGSPGTLTMRRDFHSGTLRYPEPPRPASLAEIQVITK
jgi:hypothetical protein